MLLLVGSRTGSLIGLHILVSHKWCKYTYLYMYTAMKYRDGNISIMMGSRMIRSIRAAFSLDRKCEI